MSPTLVEIAIFALAVFCIGAGIGIGLGLGLGASFRAGIALAPACAVGGLAVHLLDRL